MSTKCSAELTLTNNTGGNAFIQFSHRNEKLEPEIACWQLGPGDVSDALTVNFLSDTGSSSSDFWYASVTVQDGDNSGIYTTGGKLIVPNREFTLSEALNGADLPCTIDTGHLNIIDENGFGTGFNMIRLADYADVTNVFVFMLENHSFDHLFGFSGLDGVDGLSGDETNSYQNHTFTVHEGATDPMPIGPGHEFADTVTQLCGAGVKYKSGKSYPAIDNSGFVASYVGEGATNTGLARML
jgi:phospholipase C